jgi:hypothetical protein
LRREKNSVGNMTVLRTLSARPQIVVDASTHPVRDPGAPSSPPTLGAIGVPNPLGRSRVVSALPFNKSPGGPVQLQAPRALTDARGCLLADPAGNVVGDRQRIVVHRMLYASKTPDTRRL